MASRPNAATQRQLRTLFNLGAIGELTDGQLLERFASRGAEAAELDFAALVERHGPILPGFFGSPPPSTKSPPKPRRYL